MAEPRVAVITGAGSGIGREVSRVLASERWALILAGRRRTCLDETAQLLKDTGEAKCVIIDIDLTLEDAPAIVIAAARDNYGRLDMLVNNAGQVSRTSIMETSDALLHRLLDINLVAPARLTREAWPMLVESGSGRIINVSSMASIDPLSGFFAYAASKSGLESLSRSIHIEGHAHHIRAFSIVPGAVDTDMLREVVDESAIDHAALLDPRVIADIIASCARGERDSESGRCIYVEPGTRSTGTDATVTPVP